MDLATRTTLVQPGSTHPRERGEIVVQCKGCSLWAIVEFQAAMDEEVQKGDAEAG